MGNGMTWHGMNGDVFVNRGGVGFDLVGLDWSWVVQRFCSIFRFFSYCFPSFIAEHTAFDCNCAFQPFSDPQSVDGGG